MIYFTSDWHLGHFNIISYCNRPFKTIAEMNDTIINNCNSIVKQDDILYLLGDFSMSGNYGYVCSLMSRIMCRKICILGNHDKRRNFEQMAKDGVIEGCFDVLGVNYKNKYMWLSHYSHRVWPQSHKDSWHLFGHSHNSLPGFGLSFDVGVDAQNFFPISFDQVAKKMEALYIEKQHEIIRKTKGDKK